MPSSEASHPQSLLDDYDVERNFVSNWLTDLTLDLILTIPGKLDPGLALWLGLLGVGDSSILTLRIRRRLVLLGQYRHLFREEEILSRERLV